VSKRSGKKANGFIMTSSFDIGSARDRVCGGGRKCRLGKRQSAVNAGDRDKRLGSFLARIEGVIGHRDDAP
jgi:hypothetical protein